MRVEIILAPDRNPSWKVKNSILVVHLNKRSEVSVSCGPAGLRKDWYRYDALD